MTCCDGREYRCVGCEVDGIPLAGADWISDSWMAYRPRMPQEPRRRAVRAHAPLASPPRQRDALGRTTRRGNPPGLKGAETVGALTGAHVGLAGMTDRRSTHQRGRRGSR